MKLHIAHRDLIPKALSWCLTFMCLAVWSTGPACAEQNEASVRIDIQKSSPDDLVYMVGIVRLYERRIAKRPEDLRLRKRYVRYLETVRQDDLVYDQLKKIAALNPSDRDIQNKIHDIEKIRNNSLKPAGAQDALQKPGPLKAKSP